MAYLLELSNWLKLSDIERELLKQMEQVTEEDAE